MRLVVVSPPDERPNEVAVAQSLFSVGLERYHLRKPGWSPEKIAAWLEELPARWRENVSVHSHHSVAAAFHAGFHFRDVSAEAESAPCAPEARHISRSCHDVACVKAALGHCDAVLFGPVFPSLSKPGYGPIQQVTLDQVATILKARSEAQRRTAVLAIGGITVPGIEQCRRLGFDGVAVLGAVWEAADPVAAFLELSSATRPPRDGPRPDDGARSGDSSR